MTTIQAWGNITISSLQEVWQGFIAFLPSLIGALLVLVFGWLFAVAIGKIVSQILRSFKIDHLAYKIGVENAIKKSGYKVSLSSACGRLTQWFFIIVSVIAAADIVGLPQISSFLKEIAFYIPQVIIAAAILIISVWAAGLVSRLIKGSVKATGLISADLLATISRWAIYIFAIFAALEQLGVARSVINTLLTGFVALVAIAGGLAFGLGGREIAGEILRKAKDEISE